MRQQSFLKAKVKLTGAVTQLINAGRGKNRAQVQNFFRVVAGGIAQDILRQFPITTTERQKAAGGALIQKKKGCKKNQRKFWQLLIYSKIVIWGKQFKTVARYIVQNTLEVLNIIAYQRRKTGYNSS